MKNGDLPALAEKEFDVFVTVDKRIIVEQDLARFAIAVVLIRARTKRLEDIRQLVPQLVQAIATAKAGEAKIVSAH